MQLCNLVIGVGAVVAGPLGGEEIGDWTTHPDICSWRPREPRTSPSAALKEALQISSASLPVVANRNRAVGIAGVFPK